jgi:hypothetical protein
MPQLPKYEHGGIIGAAKPEFWSPALSAQFGSQNDKFVGYNTLFLSCLPLEGANQHQLNFITSLGTKHTYPHML